MSKKSFIDSVEVKSPCSEDWEKMHGNERVRFCDHCAKDVKNLSAVTRKEAMRLVRASDGRLCIRYVKNPVTNRPLFADQLFQITRRAPGIAAGVMSASLSLSTLTYAQGGSTATGPVAPQVQIDRALDRNQTPRKDIQKPDDSKPAARVSGTVVDPNGAVIPNTVIRLTNDKASQTKTAMSNGEGVFTFENVLPGSYIIQAEAAGFASYAAAAVVSGENTASIDIALDLGIIEAVVEVTSDINIATTFVSGGIGFVQYATPLHRAVADDDIELVRDLIAKGEKVNGRDENYDEVTPLFIAVENGNVEIARLLLDFGAKVNARDGEKQTPLMRLDDDATPELVELLLQHGAKIDVTDKSGNTALIIAAETVKPEVLRVLINAGPDIDLANKEGQNALMNAAYSDLLENVRILLVAGARVNLKNKKGETAWDQAADDEVVELLTSYGAESREIVEPAEPNEPVGLFE